MSERDHFAQIHRAAEANMGTSNKLVLASIALTVLGGIAALAGLIAWNIGAFVLGLAAFALGLLGFRFFLWRHDQHKEERDEASAILHRLAEQPN